MVAVRRRVTLACDHQPVFSFVRVDPAGATNGDEPKLKRPTNVRSIYSEDSGYKLRLKDNRSCNEGRDDGCGDEVCKAASLQVLINSLGR